MQREERSFGRFTLWDNQNCPGCSMIYNWKGDSSSALKSSQKIGNLTCEKGSKPLTRTHVKLKATIPLFLTFYRTHCLNQGSHILLLPKFALHFSIFLYLIACYLQCKAVIATLPIFQIRKIKIREASGLNCIVLLV